MKCPECGALVYDIYTTKERINLMYKINTNVGWAKNHIKQLMNMLENRKDGGLSPEDVSWVIKDLTKTSNGLKTINEKEK